MKYGYMRVSTDEQDMAMQEEALRRAGCDVVYGDTISGKTRNRPQLDEMLSRLQAGDVVVVWKLDRLGRSTGHLLMLLDDLAERGIEFSSLTENFDTTTPMGRAMRGIMAVFAQLERETIRERVQAGVRAAMRDRGYWGRRIDADQDAEIVRLRNTGMSVREVASEVGVSKSKVSDVMKRAVIRGAAETDVDTAAITSHNA